MRNTSKKAVVRLQRRRRQQTTKSCRGGGAGKTGHQRSRQHLKRTEEAADVVEHCHGGEVGGSGPSRNQMSLGGIADCIRKIVSSPRRNLIVEETWAHGFFVQLQELTAEGWSDEDDCGHRVPIQHGV